MNVTIIGGGVIGLNCAYFLQKEGYAVTVIERGDITDGCSFGNMGYMSPSHFVPLASPGIIAEGFKHMLSSNAATVKKNAPHLNNLLQLSRALINDMRNDIGDTFDMEEKGCLMMCKQQ